MLYHSAWLRVGYNASADPNVGFNRHPVDRSVDNRDLLAECAAASRVFGRVLPPTSFITEIYMVQ